MAPDNHAMVRELARHEARVMDVRKRARHWRLTDCSVETLDAMRRSLIKRMLQLEKELAEADDYLNQCIEASDPVATEETIELINRVVTEWGGLNTHLREIDDALLERQLQGRLMRLLGSAGRLAFLEMFILASIIVAIIITLIEVFIPDLPEPLATIFVQADTVLAFLLMGDFLLRLALSADKRWYFANYWVDFVASIPFVGVLRLGRILTLLRFARLLRLLRLGRALRVISFTFRGFDQLVQTLQFNLLKRSLTIAFVLLLLGAFTIRSVEQETTAPDTLTAIGNLDESLWWSFTTVVTGGFADLYNPQSFGGRLLTVGLVLLGFVVTSIFTASLTSILVEDDSSRIEENQHQLEKHLQGLEKQLDLMSRESNQGLIALEVVAQQLSNAPSTAVLFGTIVRSMVDDFDALQASVHLLDDGVITQHSHAGLERAAPPPEVAMGEAFLGRVAAELTAVDLGKFDVEPIAMPVAALSGLRLALPMVAHRRLLGLIHIVLPENLSRYYMYNRAPMTLAHHAAAATYALQVQGQLASLNM